jgi:hypothetical protein
MTVNQANKLNAKSAFQYYEVDVAVNDSKFALAA